jgi:hypothetical protein
MRAQNNAPRHLDLKLSKALEQKNKILKIKLML